VISPGLFVSCTREDSRFVSNLETSLSKNGFNVFRDTSDISPGDNFVSTITKQIREATGLIAVVSASYARSAWGKAELYSGPWLRGRFRSFRRKEICRRLRSHCGACCRTQTTCGHR
jgi:hypothetical protein